MRITSGRIVNGRIEVEGESFQEGTAVIILALDAGSTFELGPEDEAALLAAMAEGDRGEVIEAKTP